MNGLILLVVLRYWPSVEISRPVTGWYSVTGRQVKYVGLLLVGTPLLAVR